MTADTIVTNLLDELHDSTLGTRAYTWINVIQEDLDCRGYWTFLEAATPYAFSFIAPVTAGTVSVTLGSSSVVGTGTAFVAGHVGNILQVAGDDNYYYISAVNVGTQTLTLTTAYIGTTAAAATYSLDTINYALPADISLPKIKSIVIQNPSRKLERIDQSERDQLSPNPLSGRTQPRMYLDWGETQIQPWPLTDTAYMALIRYQKRPTAVSSGQTTLDWPAQMHYAIQLGALAQGWKWKDDMAMHDAVWESYQNMVRGHVREMHRKGDYIPKMRRFDESVYTDRLGLLLGRHIG